MQLRQRASYNDLHIAYQRACAQLAKMSVALESLSALVSAHEASALSRKRAAIGLIFPKDLLEMVRADARIIVDLRRKAAAERAAKPQITVVKSAL